MILLTLGTGRWSFWRGLGGGRDTIGIHWAGNKYEHLMLAGSGTTLYGLIVLPGASGVYFSEDSEEERPLCPRCGAKMDQARAIAANP
jgi:hypothetical protein